MANVALTVAASRQKLFVYATSIIVYASIADTCIKEVVGILGGEFGRILLSGIIRMRTCKQLVVQKLSISMVCV